jgi:hypothetical protein
VTSGATGGLGTTSPGAACDAAAAQLAANGGGSLPSVSQRRRKQVETHETASFTRARFCAERFGAKYVLAVAGFSGSTLEYAESEVSVMRVIA